MSTYCLIQVRTATDRVNPRRQIRFLPTGIDKRVPKTTVSRPAKIYNSKEQHRGI